MSRAEDEERAAESRVPLGVWMAADERAASWEDSYRALHAIAFRLTHCKGSGEYLVAFDDLRTLTERFVEEES